MGTASSTAGVARMSGGRIGRQRSRIARFRRPGFCEPGPRAFDPRGAFDRLRGATRGTSGATFFAELLTLFGISVIIFVLRRVVPCTSPDILHVRASSTRRQGRIDPISVSTSRSRFNTRPGTGGLVQVESGLSYVSERPALGGDPAPLPVTARPQPSLSPLAVVIGIPSAVVIAVSATPSRLHPAGRQPERPRCLPSARLRS